MGETENGMLTEKQKMKPRAVEECDKVQRDRIAVAEKLMVL